MKAFSLRKVILYSTAAAVIVGVGLWGVAAARKASPQEDGSLLLIGAAQGAAQPETRESGWGLPGGEAAVEPTTSTTAGIYVQVVGAVQKPGVYRLKRGSRVFEALEEAGGATVDADIDSLNLAAVVGDGSRIMVPAVGEEDHASGGDGADGDASSSGGAVDSGGLISLSAADAAALDRLPGIGPATAAAIISYREEHGPFNSVEELEKVPGIGPATLARIRDLVVP